MEEQNFRKIVTAAVVAALCCIATMIIQIPSPMNGYVNLGDSIVLLAGWILGPVYGTLAAAIGSMLADLLAGYPHYAIATFLIKGAIALCAAFICPKITDSAWKRILSGLVGETLMVIGYFGFAALILGNGFSAAASIPGNIIQGIVGIIAAYALFYGLKKTKLF